VKAIRIRRTGGPEVLEYVDLPTPAVGPHDVLVEARFIGVNMPEVLVRRGVYPDMPSLPLILGIEMSGIVAAVGREVQAFRRGQRVYVSARELASRGGCYAEYIAVPETALYSLPDGVSLESAATLAGLQVAYHLLHSATRGFEYGSVMVTTAGGGIGSAAVQLAVAAGKEVIALAGSDEKVRFAVEQGAAIGINHHASDLAERVAAATSGRGVDLILDPVGGARFPELFDYLAPLGLIVLYSFLGGWPANVIEPMRRRFSSSLALRLFNMHTFDDDRTARRTATSELLRLMETGAIRPAIDSRLPLSDAAGAHALLEGGTVRGRLLLTP
jgi:NADPH2:quinone reductase